jgi:hypothetical protein
MVKLEVSCDRCRAAIPADRTRLTVETGPLRAILTSDSGEPAVDLCRECAEALLVGFDRRVGQTDPCGNPPGVVRKSPYLVAEIRPLSFSYLLSVFS